MPSTTAIATNLSPRPPSSMPVQRSPVLSPRIAVPKQQRSGSARPPSPPRRLPTPPQPPSDQKTENGSEESPIDMGAFGQILELDDEDKDEDEDEDGESYEFALEMATEYFQQAEKTFEDMDDELKHGNYKKLSDLGHFLKGSSATLGVTKVRDRCESIQHYGNLRDNDNGMGKVITPEVALLKIAAALGEAKEQYKEAKAWLEKWFSDAKANGRRGKRSEDV